MKVSEASAQAICADIVKAQHAATVHGIPAVLLEVVDVDDPVELEKQTTYIITVTNQGSTDATNIKIKARADDKQELVTSSGPTTGMVSGRNITFASLASLAPKQSAAWRVNVKALSPGSVRFKVKMTSDQLEGGAPVEETEATTLY